MYHEHGIELTDIIKKETLNNLNKIYTMLKNNDIEQALIGVNNLPNGVKIPKNIFDKFLTYLYDYYSYPDLLRTYYAALYDRLTEDQKTNYNEIFDRLPMTMRSKKFKRIISSRFIKTNGKKMKSEKKGRRVVKTVIDHPASRRFFIRRSKTNKQDNITVITELMQEYYVLGKKYKRLFEETASPKFKRYFKRSLNVIHDKKKALEREYDKIIRRNGDGSKLFKLIVKINKIEQKLIRF